MNIKLDNGLEAKQRHYKFRTIKEMQKASDDFQVGDTIEVTEPMFGNYSSLPVTYEVVRQPKPDPDGGEFVDLPINTEL